MNQELPDKSKISLSIFLRWMKTPSLKKLDDPLYYDLVNCYAMALINSSVAIQKKLRSTEKGWQRFAWILERLERDRFHIERNAPPPETPTIDSFDKLNEQELKTKLIELKSINKKVNK